MVDGGSTTGETDMIGVWKQSLAFAGAGLVGVMSTSAHAATYCQASSEIHYTFLPAGTPGSKLDQTRGIECSSQTAHSGSHTSGNVTTLAYSKSLASARLADGTLKIATTAISGAATSNAYASMRDYVSIYSPNGGVASLSTIINGWIYPGGTTTFRLLSEIPTLAPSQYSSSITWSDGKYFSVPDIQQSLNGATYQDGRLTRAFSLNKGITRFLMDATIAGSGNADFSHTIGLKIALPEGASMASDSGLFLTEEQSPIMPGVGFGAVGIVPEPASWVLMLTGFGAVAGALRVRRRRVRFA